jgi:hypothetical protein
MLALPGGFFVFDAKKASKVVVVINWQRRGHAVATYWSPVWRKTEHNSDNSCCGGLL